MQDPTTLRRRRPVQLRATALGQLRGVLAAKDLGLHEPKSKLLKGGHAWNSVGEYYRANSNGDIRSLDYSSHRVWSCWDFEAWICRWV